MKAAGLPNITGEFGMFDDHVMGYRYGWHRASGAFYISRTENHGIGVRQDPDISVGVGFDASRSSSVYGKSTTVQPASYTVMYIMKIK